MVPPTHRDTHEEAERTGAVATGGVALRVVNLLLLLQAAGLWSLAVREGVQVEWDQRGVLRAIATAARDGSADPAGLLASLLPLALLALVAAVAFALRRRWGWVLAMAVQGLALASGLALWAQGHGRWIHLLLAACVVLAFLLDGRPVRRHFEPGGTA